ncbi:MAG: nucleotidyl transferase AbiEii/AbiGii toxin family protein [Coriobacteriia bacterium]|nr:nucleotidyl transferase AbiEii/AbiGii toxin family protein [Coriobacteriia bacterium]
MVKIDFAAYARQVATENGELAMLPVIEKELLHYEILRAMGDSGLLSNIVFQGGTCLRLCYGAERYSEDLDFAGGADFAATDLDDLKNCITRALPERYAVETRVVEPKKTAGLVKKWSIRINTTPERPDLPTQKIKLEVAAIPAYTKQAQMLQLNYRGLPSSYADVIVFAERLEEILADKLLAFVCSANVRYRDIWDMYWIARRPYLDKKEACRLRKKKETDYGEQETFAQGMARITDQLEELVNGVEFRAQMKRFLPLDIHERTVDRAEFRMVLCQGVRELYALCDQI